MAETAAQGAEPTQAAFDLRPFLALRQLGLGQRELAALGQQGYLQRDHRGDSDSGYWRLRFRFDHRMRTVYLGRDEDVIKQVKAELQALQYQGRFRRRAEQLAKQGRRLLRDAKQRVSSVLHPRGIHYHGDAIRNMRRANTDVT